MCSDDWDEITYSKVPSLAMNIYRKAFQTHDPDGFEEWQDRVKEGTDTINAGVLMPHQLVKNYCPDQYISSLLHTSIKEDTTTELQWASVVEAGRQYVKSLQNDLESKEDFMILGIPDFSGSMTGIPMMVSAGLCIYLAKICPEPFRDIMISFSKRPSFINLEGKESLLDCLKECARSEYMGYNTDLQATIKLIIDRCVQNKVPRNKMVKKLVIVSDMQFDQAIVGNVSVNNMDAMKVQFINAGYQMPDIVFWNVQCKDDSPAKSDERGVAMICGWSKNILNTIMKGQIADPMSIMNDVLESGRYDKLTWPDE
jgi:hypothetical protein